MRPIIYALIIIASLSGGALAQSNTSQSPRDMGTTEGTNARQAPVGHRQPTVKDLPPDVIQKEQRATSGDKKWDKSSTICKGC